MNLVPWASEVDGVNVLENNLLLTRLWKGAIPSPGAPRDVSLLSKCAMHPDVFVARRVEQVFRCCGN